MQELKQMKTKAIILALTTLLAVNGLYGSTKKDSRVTIRLPFGEALPKTRMYDGWRISGDIWFHKQMVTCLKHIETNCPEVYKKGKVNVKTWYQTQGGSWTNMAGTVWIGCRDYNFTQFGKNNWLIYMLTHEIQHNVRHNACEGAANWTAIHYGKQLKLHPRLVMYVRGFALKHNYSASLWAEREK